MKMLKCIFFNVLCFTSIHMFADITFIFQAKNQQEAARWQSFFGGLKNGSAIGAQYKKSSSTTPFPLANANAQINTPLNVSFDKTKIAALQFNIANYPLFPLVDGALYVIGWAPCESNIEIKTFKNNDSLPNLCVTEVRDQQQAQEIIASFSAARTASSAAPAAPKVSANTTYSKAEVDAVLNQLIQYFNQMVQTLQQWKADRNK